ncbi:MAG: hypothetical protein OXC44_02265 [Proteobacteria bacterium]|nr:hypothetical protein [Pseudomonadota bacterium]
MMISFYPSLVLAGGLLLGSESERKQEQEQKQEQNPGTETPDLSSQGDDASKLSYKLSSKLSNKIIHDVEWLFDVMGSSTDGTDKEDSGEGDAEDAGFYVAPCNFDHGCTLVFWGESVIEKLSLWSQRAFSQSTVLPDRVNIRLYQYSEDGSKQHREAIFTTYVVLAFDLSKHVVAMHVRPEAMKEYLKVMEGDFTKDAAFVLHISRQKTEGDVEMSDEFYLDASTLVKLSLKLWQKVIFSVREL